MKFGHSLGVAFAAIALGALGCESNNPPAQQPTTTGAAQGTSPYDQNAMPPEGQGQMQNQQMQPQNQPQPYGQPQQAQPNQQQMQDQSGQPQQGGPGSSNQQQVNPNQGMPQGAMVFENDAQVAAYLSAVNHAEVQQARLALQRSQNPQVKAYAQSMITDHNQQEQKQQRTLSTLNVTPQANAATNELQSNAQNEISSLSNKSGPDFDRAYIALQIQQHQQLLSNLKTDLIPAVHHNQYRQELMAFRPKVQEHLQRAQTLQQRLEGGNVGGGAGGGGSNP